MDELESCPAWGRSRQRQVGRAGRTGQELDAEHVSRNFSNVTPPMEMLYPVSRATLHTTSGSAAWGR